MAARFYVYGLEKVFSGRKKVLVAACASSRPFLFRGYPGEGPTTYEEWKELLARPEARIEYEFGNRTVTADHFFRMAEKDQALSRCGDLIPGAEERDGYWFMDADFE